MTKFITEKTYYCFYLKKEAPQFTGNTFTVRYKQGNKIILADPYNEEVKVECSLQVKPKQEIIKLPNGKWIWREFAQEKYENGTFERLV